MHPLFVVKGLSQYACLTPYHTHSVVKGSLAFVHFLSIYDSNGPALFSLYGGLHKGLGVTLAFVRSYSLRIGIHLFTTTIS